MANSGKIEVVVVARSKQRNGFGLYSYIAVARSGRAWRIHKSDCFEFDTILTFTSRRGEPDFAGAGYEACIELNAPMPAEQCAKIWAAADAKRHAPKSVKSREIVADAVKAPPPVDDFMRYEDGGMDEGETVEFFQRLIDCGMAWTLQGHYGRTAHALIEQGLCHS